MEPFVADFLLNKKVPKAFRILVLAAMIGSIIFICIYAGAGSPYAAGKVICFIIAAAMAGLGTAGIVKICKH